MLTKEHQVRSKKSYKNKKPKKKKIHTPKPKGEHICVACERTKYLEVHHVYFGDKPTRDFSSFNHCVEWACYHHHREQPNGVHGGNIELDTQLKQKHQLRLESEGMSRKKFIRNVGRSYL